MKDNLEKRLIALFLVIVVVLVIVAVAAVRNIQRAVASSDWVNHTHAVIVETDAILSSLQAGEAALRDYLITGDERDRAACRTAYGETVEHLETGKALTRRETSSRQRFVQLEPLIAQRVEFARVAVKARLEGGFSAVQKVVATDASGTVRQEIGHVIEKLKDEEQVSLQERDRQSYLQAQTTHWTVLTGIAINVCLVLLGGWLIRDDIAARRRAVTVLQEANAQLEAKVQERTVELARANQTLEQENLEREWTNQALEHQLRYHQLILNSIGDLVLVISKAQNISRLNPAVVRQTGWEARELVGEPLRRLLGAGEPTGSALDLIALCLNEGRELQDSRGVLFHKDGQVIPVGFSLLPLRDRDKVVGGVITIRPVPSPGSAASDASVS
ncbi:MAG: CHASE3 domain-containing protein [Limisphaerales bacterium]